MRLFLQEKFGGAKRDRTADLLHAMQALSQLSYSPIKAVRRAGPGMLREGLPRGVAASYFRFLEIASQKNRPGEIFSSGPTLNRIRLRLRRR